MLYGAIKGRAKFLLPYFCIQLFNFCVSCLVVVGYFTNKASIKMFIAVQEWFPLRNQLMAMSSGWLMFMAGVLAIVYLWVKAYFISIVWNCYKYLITTQGALNTSTITARRLELGLAQLSAVNSSTPPIAVVAASNNIVDTQILLPPKYEDVAMSADPAAVPTPPPSYMDVVAAAQQNTDSTQE